MASGAGVPGGAMWGSPVVGVASPVALRGHVQAERLGGALMWSVAARPVDFAGQRWLAVVTVGGRAVRAGQGGVESLWVVWGGRTGAGSGPGEGGGRRSSARSSGQSAVTQRDTVEALT